MKKLTVLYIIFCCVYFLMSSIIEINLDGTGDYISIQEGISGSVDGDTVLVYPGRYFENVDYSGKTITVASLELLTGERHYIRTTIIDGNQSSSCVAVYNEEGEGTALRGFTLTNGIGYETDYGRYGGGIYVFESNFDLINCIIEHNTAMCGGGILIDGSNVSLEGSTFRYNVSTFFGGGIASWCLTCPVQYSLEKRCNSYFNFSPLGKDIFNSLEIGMVTDVYMDTLTVFDPYGYEYYQGDYAYIQNYNDSNFEMLNAKLERIEADLYVSPEGDNENSGLSSDEPLQTIDRALQIISGDSENPRTIYLSDGVYSPSLNNQEFPLCMRSYVSIVGESKDNTIIDMEMNHRSFMFDFSSMLGYEIKNMSVINGYFEHGVDHYYMMVYITNSLDSTEPVLFENMLIEENGYPWITLFVDTNLTMRNVEFRDNYYEVRDCNANVYLVGHSFGEKHDLLENCVFSNSRSGTLDIGGSVNTHEDLVVDVVNCEFTNNYHESYGWQTCGSCIFGDNFSRINLVNTTIAQNHTLNNCTASSPILICSNMELNIFNSIIYNNSTTHSLILDGTYNNIASAKLYNNIIEGGEDGVYVNGYGIYDWDEDTNWDVDPMFLGDGDHPFGLQAGSPAIDMGTLELPEEIELPEYDLAGNLRIMGNGVDLGAYEYNPYGSNHNENIITSQPDILVYPNPVISSRLRDGCVKIEYSGELKSGAAECVIYNVKGQRIQSFKIQNSKFKICEADWDLCDDSGNSVSSGVYFIRIKDGDQFVSQRKVTVVR